MLRARDGSSKLTPSAIACRRFPSDSSPTSPVSLKMTPTTRPRTSSSRTSTSTAMIPLTMMTMAMSTVMITVTTSTETTRDVTTPTSMVTASLVITTTPTDNGSHAPTNMEKITATNTVTNMVMMATAISTSEARLETATRSHSTQASQRKSFSEPSRRLMALIVARSTPSWSATRKWKDRSPTMMVQMLIAMPWTSHSSPKAAASDQIMRQPSQLPGSWLTSSMSTSQR